MNAPRYGYQPYQAPREGIAITTRFSPLMWLFATVTPKIFVNGYQMPVAGWGQVVFPLTPGQYQVHVHTPYFFPQRVGPADYAAIVYPVSSSNWNTRRRCSPSAAVHSALRPSATTEWR